MSSEEIEVGDYVTVTVIECIGIIYKVDSINKQKYECWATIKPAFGLFDAHSKRSFRVNRLEDMQKVDIVRMGLEHLKVLAFIENLVKHEAGV